MEIVESIIDAVVEYLTEIISGIDFDSIIDIFTTVIESIVDLI